MSEGTIATALSKFEQTFGRRRPAVEPETARKYADTLALIAKEQERIKPMPTSTIDLLRQKREQMAAKRESINKRIADVIATSDDVTKQAEAELAKDEAELRALAAEFGLSNNPPNV